MTNRLVLTRAITVYSPRVINGESMCQKAGLHNKITFFKVYIYGSIGPTEMFHLSKFAGFRKESNGILPFDEEW